MLNKLVSILPLTRPISLSVRPEKLDACRKSTGVSSCARLEYCVLTRSTTAMIRSVGRYAIPTPRRDGVLKWTGHDVSLGAFGSVLLAGYAPAVTVSVIVNRGSN